MRERRKKKTGTPPLSRKEEVSIEVIMEQKPQKKRGRPRKNREEEVSIEVLMEEKPQKKRGRPRKSRKEEVSIEKLGNNGVEHVNNESMGNEELAGEKRGRPPLSGKEEASIEVIMDKKPQQRRGRPRKNKEEEASIEVIMDKKPQQKRGRPRKNKEEEASIEVIMDKKPQKKRGRPRKNKEEEVSIEKQGNNGVEHVNNEFMGNKELAGEEEAKGLNLEHNNAQEAVQEIGVAEKEGNEVEEENDGRSDEGEETKSYFGSRSLGQRKSRKEAQVKMVKLRVEDEELEEEMRITKRRRYRKRYEKGVGFEENGGESELNKGAGDGGNKKKLGRKRSKGLEKQEENGGRAGRFVDEKEKDKEGVDEKKVGRRHSEGKGEQEQVEEELSLSNYSLRVRKANTEEASKPKKLEDENGILLSNMCHQCQRNDKGRVVRCTKCRTKRYCVPCLTRWYAIHVNE